MNCVDLNAERAYHPSKAYFGVARALLLQRIPFEYVNEVELNNTDLMRNFSVLVIPTALGLAARTTLPLLRAYIAQGGHVVADVPFGLYDGTTGQVIDLTGSDKFDDVMGLELEGLQSSRNLPRQVDPTSLRTLLASSQPNLTDTLRVHSGLVGELAIMTAKPLLLFTDTTPAITQNLYHQGSFTLFNWQTTLRAWNRSATLDQLLLGEVISSLLTHPVSWSCPHCPAGVNVFARTASRSLHVFVISAPAAELSNGGIQLALPPNCNPVEELLRSSTLSQAGNLWQLPLIAGQAAWLRCAL
jgi:hypothetical protein